MHTAYKQRAIALAFSLLLLCSPVVFALNPSLNVSQYAHTVWKVRDGFTRGSIISIAQTPDGYLWLGTEFGLLRFDGVRNVPWQPPAGHALPSNFIMSLLAARDGTLWIGTSKGLATWKDGKLTDYGALNGYFIFAILQDHEGAIWASGLTVTTGKLCAINGAHPQCYGEDGSLGRGAFNLYEDSKDNLWAGVKNGLWRLRPGAPKFYLLDGEPDGIQALGEDTDGTLLVGWKGRLNRFVDGKVDAYPLPGTALEFMATRMLRDRNGGLWIGTTNHGLLHVHQGRTDVFAQPDGLSGDNIHAIFEDREGNIWVNTLNGLDRFRDFTAVTLTAKQGLSNDLVGSVLADGDGSVWLATRGGLDRWKNGQITNYSKRGGMNGVEPNSLFKDDHGRLWLSTPTAFGYLNGDRFTTIKSMPGGAVLSMAQDRAGSLWVANERLGLFQLRDDRVVQQIPWSRFGRQDHASVLAADPADGGLWIGFFLGGLAYFKDGQVRASYSSADGLGEGRVSSFQFEHDGTFWVSTAGGLSRFRNGHVATLTSKNGLPCDSINWVMEDNNHSFWLYTACGLVQIARPELDAWTAAVDQNKNGNKKSRLQSSIPQMG